MYEIRTITGPAKTVAAFETYDDAQVFYWEQEGFWLDEDGELQVIAIEVTGDNAIGRIAPDGWYKGHVWATEKEVEA